MQVVYSGGSNTPTPSPHLQRKNYGAGTGQGGGYSRPVMPGYTFTYPHQVVVQRPARNKLTEGDTSLRDSIPAMSKPVAVVCLVLNVLLPGLGTFVSGLTVLCGSQVRPKGARRQSVVWANSRVALLQFFLTFLLLLGWIWSIMWGTAFLTISKEYYKKSEVEEVASSHARSKPSPTLKREHRRDSTSSTHHHSSNSSPSLSSSRNHTHTRSSHSPTMGTSTTEACPPHRNGLSVNALGGTFPSRPDSYQPIPSTSGERSQPIIVLQEAPITVNHSDTPPAPTRALMNARTRHEKMLQRKISDNELSPFVLTHQKLEAIVIHDAPVTQPEARPPREAGDSNNCPAFPKH